MLFLQAISRLFSIMFKICSHILWLPIAYSNGLVVVGDKCVTSVPGVSLLKHGYKSSVVQDMFVCYNQCKHDKLCQSLNFHRDRNVCELNNRTRSVSSQVDFFPNPDAFYLENPHRGEFFSLHLQYLQSCEHYFHNRKTQLYQRVVWYRRKVFFFSF